MTPHCLIPGNKLRPGMVIPFGDRRHTVTDIVPATDWRHWVPGAVRAVCDGFSVAVDPDGLVAVCRQEETR